MFCSPYTWPALWTTGKSFCPLQPTSITMAPHHPKPTKKEGGGGLCTHKSYIPGQQSWLHHPILFNCDTAHCSFALTGTYSAPIYLFLLFFGPPPPLIYLLCTLTLHYSTQAMHAKPHTYTLGTSVLNIFLPLKQPKPLFALWSSLL